MNKIYLTLLALFATLGAGAANQTYLCYSTGGGWTFGESMTSDGNGGYYIDKNFTSSIYFKITESKTTSTEDWDDVNGNAYCSSNSDVPITPWAAPIQTWKNNKGAFTATSLSGTYRIAIDKDNKVSIVKKPSKLYFQYSDGSWKTKELGSSLTTFQTFEIGQPESDVYFMFSHDATYDWDDYKTMFAPSGDNDTPITPVSAGTTSSTTIRTDTGKKCYYFTPEAGYKYTLYARYSNNYNSVTFRVVKELATPDYLYVHFSDNNWLHYEQCGNSQTEFQTVEINDAWFNSEGNLYFVFTSNGTYNSSNPSSNLSNLYAPSGTSSTLVTPVETGSSTTISINRATGSKSYRIEREANCKYTLRAHYKSNYGAVVFQVVKERISNPDDPINPDLPGLIVDTTIFATDVTGFTSLESWKVDAEGASTEHRTDELTANDNNKVKYFYNKGYQFNSLTLTGDGVTSVSTDSPLDPDHGYILYLSNAPADKKFVTNLQVKITNKTGGNVRYVDFHHVVMAETMEGTYTSDDIAYKAGDVIAGICSGEELLYPLGGTEIESGTALSIATNGTTPNSITSAVGTALESYYLRLDVTNLTLTLIRKGGNNDIQSGYLFLHYGFGDGSDQSNWNYTRRLGKDPDIFDVSEPFRVTEDTEVFFAFTESTRMFPWAADQVDTFCPDEPTDAQTWASDDPTRVETTETNGEGWSYWKFTAEPDRTYRWYATLSDPEYYTEDENPESTENNPIVKTCHSVRFFIIYVVDTPDDNTGFLIDQVNFAVAELEPVNQTIESCYIPTPVYGGDNLKTITTNPSHDMTYTWVKYSNEDISYNLDWKYYQCDTYIPETRNDIINKVIYYYAHTKVPGEKRNLTKEDVVNRPWAVHMNTSVEHDCRNFDDVYYRMYGEADVLPIITTPVETMGKLRAVIIPDNQAIRARVAYAVPVDNNTTGIEGITIDNEQQGGNKPQYDGAPEYYNLQGVRVMHPSAGQIYIVRRGSVVTKEIIR